jgi:hypothetical protein
VEPTVRQKPLGVVDRVVPMFREHAAGMADREASVVRVERVVLLELENEDGHADDGRRTGGSRKRVKDSRSEGSNDDGRKGRTTRKRRFQPRTGFLRDDFIGAYRWMRGLVGANVVKKTIPRRNRRRNRLRRDRQV